MTKEEIRKLGERIRRGLHSERDLELLAEHRQSFRAAYLHVAELLKDRGIEVTGRTKSNISIERKLKRQPTLRLSQMQDIEGCRIVVPDFEVQEAYLMILSALFSETKILDRRARPVHGYRAVHVIVTVGDHDVEIQVRTTLQHLWANLSERIADELSDPAVKYGGGPKVVRNLLSGASTRIAAIEKMEEALFYIEAEIDYRPAAVPDDVKSLVPDAKKEIEERKTELMAVLAQSVAILERGKVKRNEGKQ